MAVCRQATAPTIVAFRILDDCPDGPSNPQKCARASGRPSL